MLVITGNEINIKIKDKAPSERYKRICNAINTAFRWRGCVPENCKLDTLTDGEHLIILSILMAAILNNTVVSNNDVCIRLYEDPEEYKDYFVRALVSAIGWSVYDDRRNSDKEDVLELTQLIEQFVAKEIPTTN